MNLFYTFERVIHSFGMQTITHPLFYHAKAAIRFNIGDNDNDVYLDEHDENVTVHPTYVSTCLERANQIYQALRNAPNILVIEGYLCENDSVEDFINTVITATDLQHPQETKIQKISAEGEEFNHIFLCWELNEFNPSKLLQKIIIADLGGGNHFLTSSVYFVCSEDNILFHLYDDRGADLCAEKAVSISHIYKQLNHLILEYDREKIDSIFKAR